MNIFQKIKEFINRITNKTPQIEAPKEIPDEVVAPKGTKEEDTIESFASNLQVSEKELLEVPVTFVESLGAEMSQKLDKTIGNIGGKLGWTHSSVPTIYGKLNGKSFESIKRLNAGKAYVGQTICAENGYYDIRTSKSNNPQEGKYSEHLRLEDGTTTSFSTILGSDSDVYSVVSKNGIKLIESAEMATVHGQGYEFGTFAQPSNELLEEYSKTTGLPIIMDSHKIYGDDGFKAKTGLDIKDLTMTMREQDSRSSFPFIISIEASKQTDSEQQPKKKMIKYAYTSPEAYKNGEKPYMIYMDGIDGREGFSGMFRLKGDSYVDNSTFRRENGVYTYDTISYEQVMDLAGKMPTQLSKRVESVIMGKFRIPSEVQEIYSKAIAIEAEKEKPSQGIEIS